MNRIGSPSLLAAAAAGVVGYVLIARAVSARKTTAKDRKARSKIQRTRAPKGEMVAQAAGPIGKEWFYIPLTAAISGYLWHQQRGWPSATPLLSAVAVESLSRVLDRLPPHRQPPPGQPKRNKPSFPSGHAMETTAVAMTTAYVLARENLAPPVPAFATAAALALISPAGRIYLDRHWISDALGGACAGLAVAAVSAAIYDLLESDGVSFAAV